MNKLLITKLIIFSILIMPIKGITKIGDKLETERNLELEKIQKKTIFIHKELTSINLIIKNLDLDIKKNKQSQIIIKKYIEDEEILAQEIILLLQQKYYSNPVKEFLESYNTKNNFSYLTKKVVTKFFLENIKEEINFFLEGLNEVRVLDNELRLKISKLNSEKEKLRIKKKKLDLEVKKKLSLQKQNPKTKLYRNKQKKIKKRVSTINDLVSGVSSINSSSNRKNTKGIILPVRGSIISKFGETKKPFPSKDGLLFEFYNEPYVVSPINGVVIFAGRFRSYGNLIIIQNRNHYHTILSGMDEIIVITGNKVLKGEPIAKNYFIENSKKKLYFELRFKGKPIDPKREVEIL